MACYVLSFGFLRFLVARLVVLARFCIRLSGCNGFCGSFLGVVLCGRSGFFGSWGIVQSGQGEGGFDNKKLSKVITSILELFEHFLGSFWGYFSLTFAQF
jgi:hypothetical protein